MKHRGINIDFIDTTIEPGNDFYQFVNGGWMKQTEIPSDRGSWGSFHQLAKETDQKMLNILKEELATPGSSSNKAARLFETGMDTITIERRRLSSIAHILSLALTQELPAGLADFLGNINSHGIHAFVHFSVHPDLGNSKMYAAYLEPAGLGLPDKAYYFDQEEGTEHIRSRYQEYIAFLLEQEAGFTKEKSMAAATSIFTLEKGLAAQMLSKEDRRHIDKLYNPHTYKELAQLMESWNWDAFFSSTGIAAPDRLIITEPKYFAFLSGFIEATPAEQIRDYLTFMTIHQAAPFAHSSLEQAHFDLYSKTLDGIEVMRPREERIVKVVNQSLGELLGQMFVARHFPPDAKARAIEMTKDITEAFQNRIKKLPWMSESTRSYALEKLDAFKVKIGYPDQWRDFSALTIKGPEKGGDYLQNVIAMSKWKQSIDYQRIGKEVDREEWFMAPQVVNAYYNPMFNEIVFPAAILQPPFFDWEADAAVNYGGIGAVIGHEMTHGFDDQGSRFDKYGNLSEWWTAEDKDRFQVLTSRLVEQFNTYRPFDDLPLNGTFTLGENIADLGGLSVAYDALQLYYNRHGRPDVIDGYTPEQRFFMSWATVWRTKIRPEALRTQIKTDPHPPGLYRAVAAPSNMESFYHAFQIRSDSKWYRPQEIRIKIW